MCLDEEMKLKHIVGRGPVQVSLFNEVMSLHEAGVGGVVHKVACMYCARGGRWCLSGSVTGSLDHTLS
jgi:hypothetical protein